MTDVMPEQTTENEDWSDVENSADGASYPEYPSNPHNHRFTISFDGRGPMVVVRGNTAAEIVEGFQELEQASTGAAMGNAWAAIKAAAAVASGAGPVTVVPNAPAAPPGPAQQVAQAYPTPAPVPPAVPGVPGQAPAAWQNAGGPVPPPPPAPQGGYGQQGGGRAEPKPRPPWPQVYKISLARGDSSFKDYRSANQQYFKGKVQWAGGGDYWIHGEVAQAVAQWNPVPA